MSNDPVHHPESSTAKLGFDRLVFFSDAVMAIAITLMALEIRLPEIEPTLISVELPGALRALSPRLFVYFLSFTVIGVYWVLHHRLFRLIHNYDGRLLVLNLLYLMFVALVPASTNALGTYPNEAITVQLYAVSVALMGLAQFAGWYYAQNRAGILVEGVSQNLKRYFNLRILVPPTVFLVSLPIADLSPPLAQLSWALMIPMFFALRIIFSRDHAERNRIFGEV